MNNVPKLTIKKKIHNKNIRINFLNKFNPFNFKIKIILFLLIAIILLAIIVSLSITMTHKNSNIQIISNKISSIYAKQKNMLFYNFWEKQNNQNKLNDQISTMHLTNAHYKFNSDKLKILTAYNPFKPATFGGYYVYDETTITNWNDLSPLEKKIDPDAHVILTLFVVFDIKSHNLYFVSPLTQLPPKINKTSMKNIPYTSWIDLNVYQNYGYYTDHLSNALDKLKFWQNNWLNDKNFQNFGFGELLDDPDKSNKNYTTFFPEPSKNTINFASMLPFANNYDNSKYDLTNTNEKDLLTETFSFNRNYFTNLNAAKNEYFYVPRLYQDNFSTMDSYNIKIIPSHNELITNDIDTSTLYNLFITNTIFNKNQINADIFFNKLLNYKTIDKLQNITFSILLTTNVYFELTDNNNNTFSLKLIQNNLTSKVNILFPFISYNLKKLNTDDNNQILNKWKITDLN